MSNRQNDIRGERALGLFLDKYFYPSFQESEGFGAIQRVFGAKEQKQGADILITDSNGNCIVVDEKAQLKYINEPRHSFIFELSFISEKTKSVAEGWFTSDSNKTDRYILIWINSARTNQLNRIVKEDFEKITIAFISKQRIRDYLSGLGYPVEVLRKISTEMRADNIIKKQLSKDSVIYYTQKEGVPEKPINVLINTTVLWEAAYSFYKVDKEKCIKIDEYPF